MERAVELLVAAAARAGKKKEWGNVNRSPTVPCIIGSGGKPLRLTLHYAWQRIAASTPVSRPTWAGTEASSSRAVSRDAPSSRLPQQNPPCTRLTQGSRYHHLGAAAQPSRPIDCVRHQRSPAPQVLRPVVCPH